MPALLGATAAAASWLLLAGCGNDEVPEPSIPAFDPITLPESPDAGQAGPGGAEEGAARPGEPTASEACIDLATQEKWDEALDPCTRAALEHPDDPEIQKALEHALGADEAEID